MSARAAAFLDEWMRDYVVPGPYAGSTAEEARGKRDKLVSDAHQLGISSSEFEEEVGDLHQFLSKKLDEKTASEVWRLGETGGIDI
jgi:hypothetical protein